MHVSAANVQDRDGARPLLAKLDGVSCRLQRIFADSGYRGSLVDWVKQRFGWDLTIVPRRAAHVFEVLAKRWIVERTFGWLGRDRRLSKDYEGLCETTEAMIYASMSHLMLRRLAPA